MKKARIGMFLVVALLLLISLVLVVGAGADELELTPQAYLALMVMKHTSKPILPRPTPTPFRPTPTPFRPTPTPPMCAPGR